MTAVFPALAACLAVAAATAVFLPLTRRLGWLDTPDHRSAHRQATPSSGGLAVIAGLAGTLAALTRLEVWRPQGSDLILLTLVVLLCLAGAADDRRPLPVRVRLPLYLLVSALAVWALGLPAALPLWALPLLVLALGWLLNLYNFMDGIDGLAALQCVFTAGGLAFFAAGTGASPDFVVLAAATAGAYAGFAVFNWPPARLFMGDAGSLSAGLLLGWLGLWCLRDAMLPIPVWLLLMSPFLLDTGYTLLRRALRGERVTEAHNTHVYQRLARHLGAHRSVDLGLLALHLLLLQPLAALAVFGVLPAWTSLGLGLFPQLLLIAKFHRLQ